MLAQQGGRIILNLLYPYGFVPANTLAFGKAKHMQIYFLELTGIIIKICPELLKIKAQHNINKSHLSILMMYYHQVIHNVQCKLSSSIQL